MSTGQMWIDLLINSLSNNFSLFQLETKTTFYKQCWPNMVSIWKKLYLKCHYPLINYPDQYIWKKNLLSKGCFDRKIVWWISWWANKTDFFWSYEPDSLQVWWKTRTTKNWKLVTSWKTLFSKCGLFLERFSLWL